MKYFGFGVGIHASTYNGSDSYIRKQDVLNNAVPTVYLRWGYKKYFFGDIGYFWNFHAIGLPALFQIGAGSGFGRDNFIMRFGYSVITEEKNLMYMDFEYKIKKLAIIHAGLAFPNEIHGFVGLQFPIGSNYDKARKQ